MKILPEIYLGTSKSQLAISDGKRQNFLILPYPPEGYGSQRGDGALSTLMASLGTANATKQQDVDQLHAG